MSLFRRVHIRTVPPEFLDPGCPPIQLRFCQLNAKKMEKADLEDTIKAIEKLKAIMERLSEEARAAAIARQAEAPSAAVKPNTFDDYDNDTMLVLAHVERRTDDSSGWVELTPEELDDLSCAEWLAGEIYDVSRSKSAEARGKNSWRWIGRRGK